MATFNQIVAAHYHASADLVELALSTGYSIIFPPSKAQELAGSAPADLDEIEIDPMGLSVYFPRIDGGIYLPGLLEGLWGTKRWMAQQLGAASSTAKADAARADGAKGGRPRKQPAVAAG